MEWIWKMEMRNKKLDLVLEAIAKAKQITPKGREVKAYPRDVEWARTDIHLLTLHPEELNLVLEKLQNDEKVLRVKAFVDPSSVLPVRFRDFTVELLDNFDTWYAKYRAEKEVPSESLAPTREREAPAESEVVYRITYTKAREILLSDVFQNEVFQLAKPDFDSENELVFNYLYEHPNQRITRQEIEDAMKVKLTKSFNKIVDNLGFKGDLRRLFFNVSKKTSIQFTNPITEHHLNELGIKRIKLP